MAIFAVTYRYDRALADARASVRAAHNEWLVQLVATGQALCTGPFTDGSGGLLVFNSSSLDDLKRLLNDDPFSRDRLVQSTTIVEWRPVHGSVGATASTPVR
ncbi:YciI family protein [Rhodococcus sp. PvR099]|jgi:uncharacterized protein|uniref:YciI family protein n=1 Tax=Rhodococcus sp. PvR099 TaxID=2806602 RepID=UPI001AE3B816|nr:YciI family protein [Rhodococcus sp. PvR099]MBP1161545.1 uncharacterized protein YciI [Rhodococcus sp. PvR099]